MDKYVIKNKNNSKLFYMDKDSGGYCDWIDTDEQLKEVLKNPNYIVYFDSFDHAWDYLSGNENVIGIVFNNGTGDVYEALVDDKESHYATRKIQYFGTIEKLAN